MTGSIGDRFFNYDGAGIREGAGVVRFLADRSESDWTTLVERTETRRYTVGHTIIAAGERDLALYLLTEGVVGVVLPGSQGTFKEIDAPSVLGEVAFVDAANGRRRRKCTASVRVCTGTVRPGPNVRTGTGL